MSDMLENIAKTIGLEVARCAEHVGIDGGFAARKLVDCVALADHVHSVAVVFAVSGGGLVGTIYKPFDIPSLRVLREQPYQPEQVLPDMPIALVVAVREKDPEDTFFVPPPGWGERSQLSRLLYSHAMGGAKCALLHILGEDCHDRTGRLFSLDDSIRADSLESK